jgi:hypothetical protein
MNKIYAKAAMILAVIGGMSMLVANAGGNPAQFGQTVKFYLDPGTQVVGTVVLKSGTFSGRSISQLVSCNTTFSGTQIPD